MLGGDDGIRTHDPLLAGQVLSQLSYTPVLPGSFCSLLIGSLKIEQQAFLKALLLLSLFRLLGSLSEPCAFARFSIERR